MSVAELLKNTLLGCHPLIYMETSEEERVLKIIKEVCDAVIPNVKYVEWSCIHGFENVAESTDPVVALTSVLNFDAPCCVLFKDIDDYVNRPEVVRALRDIVLANLAEKGIYVFLISSKLILPERLKKEIAYIPVPSPQGEEILSIVTEVMQKYPNCQWNSEILNEVTLALKGMTSGEMTHLLHRLFKLGINDIEQIMEFVFREKELLVKKSGYLEFFPPRWDINMIGGLGNLKDWLISRQKLFSQEALDQGVPIPKGLLMMGVSGCGKSLAVKTISSMWHIPLFRLDMSLVFSGRFGKPEDAFHNALEMIEAVAPAVLWIDEIENALGMDESGNTISSQIFSSFLTWMQEKPPLVFIAATANKINALPAEILRKGRFDEVFFIDLPNDVERKEILEIHLRQHGADPAAFDLTTLVAMTKDWNGAEIGEAIIAAKVAAYADGNRPMTMKDVSLATTKIVPLATTMTEQIKFIRSWAFSRATPASRNARVGRR